MQMKKNLHLVLCMQYAVKIALKEYQWILSICFELSKNSLEPS